MSARILSMLTLLASLCWFWLGHKWHCCWIRGACCEKVELVAPDALKAAGPASLLFKWSEPQVITNEQFAAYKTQLLKDNSGDNLLEIVGKYYADEKNTSNYDNLGLARANEIKALFMDQLPEERIRIRAALADGKDIDSSSTLPSADFKWIKVKTEESEVVVMADRTIILFPYNSAQKVADPNVDEYLDKLVTRIKKSGEKVRLTGHTDSDGDETANNQLGMRRANYIANLLVQKGIKRSQIESLSKGESSPVASNDTDEGKHQNRRVELKISSN